MQCRIDRDRLSTFVNFVRIPSIAPLPARWQVNFLRALPFLPNRRKEQVRAIKISLPVRPCLRRFWINQEERTNDRHAGLMSDLSVAVAVINQTLVQPRIKP